MGMVLLVDQVSSRLMDLRRKRSQVSDHTTILIQHPSRHQLVRGVLDVEVLYLLLNSSSPKERCGTRSASTVQTVIDLWIQYWHVMVLTVRYTARHAIQRSLVPRALVMAMLLLWCLPMENRLFLTLTPSPQQELRHLKDRAVHDVVFLYMLLSR
jgi:hypothetical protein